MNLKIIFLRGIPGSGKSTWARKFIKNNSKTWVIINRDSIRDMLGNYWVPEREKLVTFLEKESIVDSLSLGFNVIVDATNFNKKSVANILDYINWHKTNFNGDLLDVSNIDVEFKDFDISLEKAIRRDFWRGLTGGRKVGKKVIKDFYNKYVKVQHGE